jgi:RNA polymerase sigma factor (sigma-70 family)
MTSALVAQAGRALARWSCWYMMGIMADDLELLERWRAGDRDAGNRLFERYFTSVCRFFENKIQGDAEELVQSTFLACVNNRDSFREQSSFRTYLFSIARYQLYGFYRNRQKNNALDFGVTSVAAMNTGPVSRLARGQDHERLLEALCSLPLEQQMLLELFYWENMEAAQLAEIFDVAPTTVRTRLHRARHTLRERMLQLAEKPGDMDLSVDNLDEWARALEAKRDPD